MLKIFRDKNLLKRRIFGLVERQNSWRTNQEEAQTVPHQIWKYLRSPSKVTEPWGRRLLPGLQEALFNLLIWLVFVTHEPIFPIVSSLCLSYFQTSSVNLYFFCTDIWEVDGVYIYILWLSNGFYLFLSPPAPSCAYLPIPCLSGFS